MAVLSTQDVSTRIVTTLLGLSLLLLSPGSGPKEPSDTSPFPPFSATARPALLHPEP